MPPLTHSRRSLLQVLSQQAADTNVKPMPILSRRPTVRLPSDLSEVEPGARELVLRGLDIADESDNDADGLADGGSERDGGVELSVPSSVSAGNLVAGNGLNASSNGRDAKRQRL